MDNAQRPYAQNGGEGGENSFHSANITPPNQQFFTAANSTKPSGPKIFFGKIANFFKHHHFIRACLILIIIAIPLSTWVILKTVLPRDILIGDITVTRASINFYADELREYKALNPNVTLDDPVQFAEDNLVLNAAFRYHAKTTCANSNISDVSIDTTHDDPSSYYLRIPAENEFYKRELQSCLIPDKSIFSTMINFDSPYFLSLSPDDRATAYAKAKQTLKDTFLPLFEAKTPSEEIAAKADANFTDLDNFDLPDDIYFTQMVTEAAYDTCQGDATDCFNDIEMHYEVDPGELFSMAEQIQDLCQIGDYTEVFASKTGTFAIIRLEDKTGGIYNSYDDFLDDIKAQYMSPNFFEKLFAFASDSIASLFAIDDASAIDGRGIVNVAIENGICGGHTVNFYIRAQTDVGLNLDGWEVRITQNSNSCIVGGSVNGIYGPPERGNYVSQAVLTYITNCWGSGPNFTSTNEKTLMPSDLITKNPPGYGNPLRLIMRHSNDTNVDLNATSGPNVNKTIPWNQSWINQRPNGNGIVIIYKGQNLDTGFASSSSVAIGRNATHNESAVDGTIRMRMVNPIEVTSASPDPTVTVSFNHYIHYNGPDPNDYLSTNNTDAQLAAISDLSISSCTPQNSYRDPCTSWHTGSEGDILTNVNGVGQTFATRVIAGDNINRKLLVAATRNKTLTLPDKPAPGTSIDYEICEGIKYGPKGWLDSNGDGKYESYSGSKYSRACAIVTVKNTDAGNEFAIGSCPLPNSAHSENKGGTQAASGVRNLTASDTWTTTTETNHEAVVWAKPGDSVQFKHTLCFGAQAVRGSKDPAANGSKDPRRDVEPDIANSATITAFTAPSTNGNYLFGNTLSGTHTKSFDLGIATARPSVVSTADEKGDYWFTYYSPSANPSAADKYKCYSANAGFSPFVSPGYQIPNFTADTKPNDCKTVAPAIAPSDAGKTIEQDLAWNNVQSWIASYSDNLGKASCGCGTSDVIKDDKLSPNFDQADVSGKIKSGKDYYVGYHVLDCYSTGRACGCCGRTCTKCHTQNDKTDYRYHPIATTNSDAPTKKAQVKIPFNYTTTTRTHVSNNNGVVYGGEDTRIEAAVKVEPRKNPEIPDAYSTISKPTVYEVVSFTIDPDVGDNGPSVAPTIPSILQENKSASGGKDNRVCNYYLGGLPKNKAHCQSIIRVGDNASENIRLNPEGDINGPDEKSLLHIDLNIPDLPVGTKFCVSLGVWPSDSHDNIGSPENNDIAMRIDNPGTWNYSKATCVTISKKPTVQFWGQSIYTSGNIKTSTSKKNLSYNIPGNNTPCKFNSYIPPAIPATASGASGPCGASTINNGSIRTAFGSWSEYDTIARGNIVGFATGAGFGYRPNNGGYNGGTNINAALNAAKAGGYPNVGYNSSTDPKPCVYSTQTLNNSTADVTNCSVLGGSSINNVGLASTLSRLSSRYLATSQEALFVSTITPTLFASTQYTKVKPTAGGDAGSISINEPLCVDSTRIIDVTGTLIINANITYGKLVGGKCAPQNYKNIAELPQLLIFAKDITIGEAATNIDAWLITGRNSTGVEGDGLIRTCPNTPASSLQCAAKLTINGPVFASKLELNRTAGALQGTDSIEPAEVFNLRSDTYFWAYSQAQNFSQAVTTYSRELAPRF